MDLDITEFLPKYPNIQKKTEELFNPYNDDFYHSIYRKKEFYDERLPAVEEFPEVVGTQMKHQKIISRFLSSRTPYDQLLLVHEMGCVDPSTPIAMWNGDIITADQVKEGDLLIGDDGNSREVLTLVNGSDQMYKVVQSNSSSYIVNSDHILSLKICDNRSITLNENKKSWQLFWLDKDKLQIKHKTESWSMNGKSSETAYEFIRKFRESLNSDDTLDISVKKYLQLPISVKNMLRGYKCQKVYSDKVTRQVDNPLTSHIDIEPVGFGNYVGWELNGNGRFLLDDFTVTHNTGKTCTAIGAIEQILKETSSFTGAMIFARGEGLLNNFRNELIFQCTKGKYIPRPEGMIDPSYEELIHEYEKLTELEKVHRTKKAIRDFYTLNTFETFAKMLKSKRDEDIIKEFSNKIIVIDEVHNLRLKEKKEGLDLYAQFFRLCHVAKNTKIILMSGTPMKDTPDEIASVMNLILPLDKQLPTGDDFIAYFFDQIGEDKVRLKKDKIPELKNRFKGRVSYLKAMQSEVEKVFEGETSGTLTHFKVVEDYMSDFQTLGCNSPDAGDECKTNFDKYKNGGYIGAYKRDQSEKGVYAFSRQATLFVFPDGSYGSEGFNKYMDKTAKRGTSGLAEAGAKKMYNYTLGKKLRSELSGKTHEEILQKLERFSSKYASTIRSLLKAYDNGQSSFVYLEFVKGSGAILFSKILELFGYSHARGNIIGEKKRYAIVTNETATQKEIKTIIKVFNHPDNMNGANNAIVIGSRVIGEGFSLKNVQEENILTPHWNYSETDQAIARGYRLGSHRALLANGVVPQVRIFQRVSIPTEGVSIDLEMYEISEIKDMNIKQIERVLSESSFDCSLNYFRNRRIGKDGDRDCDYMDCDYKCDGVSEALITEEAMVEDLDYSTYQIYYASPNIKKIMEELVDIFRQRFKMSLNDIIENFSEYTAFEIKTALRTMINESRRIINKYGFSSYLKEESNVFFLVDSLSDIGNYFSEYYTKKPNIAVDTTFSSIVNNMNILSFPKIVNEICYSEDANRFKNLIVKLPLSIQEIFLESAILAKKKGIPTNLQTQQMVLEHFKEYYQDINGIWVSSLLYRNDTNEPLRCLENEVWKDCGENYIQIIEQQEIVDQTKLEESPYGYYGQYNPVSEKFWLRSVEDETATQAGDKRKRTRGKECKTWDGLKLTNIIVNILKIPAPDVYKPTASKDLLWNSVQSGKWTKQIFKDASKDDMDIEDIRRASYWSSTSRIVMCKAIHEFLTKEGWVTVRDK